MAQCLYFFASPVGSAERRCADCTSLGTGGCRLGIGVLTLSPAQLVSPAGHIVKEGGLIRLAVSNT
jgi:hypothetical protein